ncbi:g1920 [Coccomyxa elongata]
MSGVQTASPPAAGPHSYAEVVAAPPPSSSSNKRGGNTGSRGQPGNKSDGAFLGLLKLQGLQHYLRLRKRLTLTDQLSAELGVDLNVKRQTYLPHAALSYELLGKDGKKIATLRATRQSLFIRKTFPVNPPRVSFNLHTTAGVSYKGQPEFAVDVDNIKPTGLVVVAAVAMLLLGKPLSGSRGFGGLQFGLPRIGDCTAKAETKAIVERNGKGLMVSVKQLNGVLRF